MALTPDPQRPRPPGWDSGWVESWLGRPGGMTPANEECQGHWKAQDPREGRGLGWRGRGDRPTLPACQALALSTLEEGTERKLQFEERRSDLREGFPAVSGPTLKCRCHPSGCGPRSRLACLEARSLPGLGASDSVTPRKGRAAIPAGLVYNNVSCLQRWRLSQSPPSTQICVGSLGKRGLQRSPISLPAPRCRERTREKQSTGKEDPALGGL